MHSDGMKSLAMALIGGVIADRRAVQRSRRDICHIVTKQPLSKRQRRRLRGKATPENPDAQ